MLFSTTSISYASSPTVILDGEELYFDVPPIIEDGRTLVPFRAIFEALGADVSWDPSDQSVTAHTSDGTELTLWIGSKTVSLNGDTFDIDVAPRIINGRTLIPLRVVSEALGADVDWDSYSQTVFINDNNSKPAVDSGPIDQESILAAARATLERLYNDNGRGNTRSYYDICLCIDTYSYAFNDNGELCLFFHIKSVQPQDSFIYVDPNSAYLSRIGNKWSVDCFGYDLVENPEMEAYYQSLFSFKKETDMPQTVYQDYGNTGQISIGKLPY